MKIISIPIRLHVNQHCSNVHRLVQTLTVNLLITPVTMTLKVLSLSPLTLMFMISELPVTTQIRRAHTSLIYSRQPSKAPLVPKCSTPNVRTHRTTNSRPLETTRAPRCPSCLPLLVPALSRPSSGLETLTGSAIGLAALQWPTL